MGVQLDGQRISLITATFASLPYMLIYGGCGAPPAESHAPYAEETVSPARRRARARAKPHSLRGGPLSCCCLL